VPRISNRLCPLDAAVRRVNTCGEQHVSWSLASHALQLPAYLGAIVLDCDLHVSIGVLLRLQAVQRRLNFDQKTAGMRDCRFVCVHALSNSPQLDMRQVVNISYRDFPYGRAL
jgi:hypothetical protein